MVIKRKRKSIYVICNRAKETRGSIDGFHIKRASIDHALMIFGWIVEEGPGIIAVAGTCREIWIVEMLEILEIEVKIVEFCCLIISSFY